MSNATSLSMPQSRPGSLIAAVSSLGLRSLLAIPALLIPPPDDVDIPAFAIVEAIIVAVAVLACSWAIWNGNKLAAKLAILLVVVDTVLSVPGFFVGLGAALVILNAVAVILGLAAIVLLVKKSTWSVLR
jgi:hypothetical protein